MNVSSDLNDDIFYRNHIESTHSTSAEMSVAIIPKSVKIKRMVENRDIFDFTLDDQDFAQIATLNRDEIIFNQCDPRRGKRLVEHRG